MLKSPEKSFRSIAHYEMERGKQLSAGEPGVPEPPALPGFNFYYLGEILEPNLL